MQTLCRLQHSAKVCLLAATLLAPVAAFADASAPRKLQPALFSVSLNGQSVGEAQLLLRDSEGGVYATEAELKLWRLRIPRDRSVEYEGETFYRVDSNVVKAVVSEADQALAIEVAAGLFEHQKSSLAAGEDMAMTPAATGAFANYDLFAEAGGGVGKSLNGSVEFGFFSRHGVAVSSFVAHAGGGKANLVRLDTGWTMDRPGAMASLRVGDGISGGGPSAPPVRFNGIQYARNFGVRPGFLTMPVRTFSGSAAVPSVVDVYVNNVLQGSREVAPGPFDISGVPLQSGGGEVQLIVRDMLGREMISSQSYYSSSQLLRRGLHDFSYEAGFLRRDFGIKSNSYGSAMVSATHRYGVSNRLTVEGHAQATRQRQVAGGGATIAWPRVGMASAFATFSNSEKGTGSSVGLALERRTQGLSMGVRSELASRDYRFVGMGESERTPKITTQAFVDFPFFGGTVGANYLRRDHHDGKNESLAGIFGSVDMGKMGAMQLFARRSTFGRRQTTFGAQLSLSLDGRRSASAGVERVGRQLRTNFDFQRSAPVEGGSGYRASLSTGTSMRAEGTYSYNSGNASYSAQVAHSGGRTGVRLSASGAIGNVGRGSFMSRRLGSSFAEVRVDGFPGVRVYADNQLVGTTDKNGRVIVPALRAYERNVLRIDESDLPLDVQFGQTEVAVRPYGRSGTIVRFAAERERGALLKVVLDDGGALPAGARVFEGNEKEGAVTVAGGSVYMPNLVGRKVLRAEWKGGSCTIDAAVPDNDDPQPMVDGLVCKSSAYAAR